jgi:GDP-L-fucose synthase
MTIKELASLICEVVGFRGKVEWDHSKPDGTPQKLLDRSLLLSLGWQPFTDLKQGLEIAYQDMLHKELV